ncbi:hypothetical protein HRG_003845 [Hirsutella rhossiliensis]|uniref:Uncharacterized protein n=1 Tax=Hirsutella rhossiliensis TaxID=111463 RepID=A0A9P8N2V2_9HYPO|nr:uncharacterized protein HRG_03845 [Hirsutella rhossiliensis]KAH0965829.1 hypothetical protein HRG_03845 [Hirsutella rhossiliensis]
MDRASLSSSERLAMGPSCPKAREATQTHTYASHPPTNRGSRAAAALAIVAQTLAHDGTALDKLSCPVTPSFMTTCCQTLQLRMAIVVLPQHVVAHHTPPLTWHPTNDHVPVIGIVLCPHHPSAHHPSPASYALSHDAFSCLQFRPRTGSENQARACASSLQHADRQTIVSYPWRVSVTEFHHHTLAQLLRSRVVQLASWTVFS